MVKREWVRLKKLTGSDWKEETKPHEKADVVLKQRNKENSHDDGNDDDNVHGNAAVLYPRRGTYLAEYLWAEQEEDVNTAAHTAAAGLLSTL